MREETQEKPAPLRTGLTTGCCATACSLASAYCLLTGQTPDEVDVQLPLKKAPKMVQLSLCDYKVVGNYVTTRTIKDAGDDPDVTHKAKIWVQVRLIKKGITFHAGKGVGTVTRSGLLLAVGEPAINPVPRKMMTEHLQRLAKQHDYDGGFELTIGVEKGEQLALKTMNPRLGILGGLSILGTTGIVRPFSCSAYIASIHQGIDVARSNDVTHIAASTGNTSEAFIQQHYQLSEMALIEMGDFVGAVLKYLKRHPVEKLSICAGFGKLSKLAKGHLDLHSRTSRIDFEYLAKLATKEGGGSCLYQQIKTANTSLEAVKYSQQQQVDIVTPVCWDALQVIRSITPCSIDTEVWAIDRQGKLIGFAQ